MGLRSIVKGVVFDMDILGEIKMTAHSSQYLWYIYVFRKLYGDIEMQYRWGSEDTEGLRKDCRKNSNEDVWLI